MKQSFSSWFKLQATRQDAVGALARKYTKFRGDSVYALTDAIESGRYDFTGTKKEAELKTAYAALEEYERIKD